MVGYVSGDDRVRPDDRIVAAGRTLEERRLLGDPDMVARANGFARFSRAPPFPPIIEWKSLVDIQTPDAIGQSVPISIALTGLRWIRPEKPVLSPTRNIEPEPI